MSGHEYSIDDLLNATTFDEVAEHNIPDAPSSLAEFSGIDPRILNLSYSSLLTLHSCPQKFQLYKLSAETTRNDTDEESITFSYGHCVGLGIQLVLENKAWDEIVWRLFLEWKPSILECDVKRNKSFAHALFAVQKFVAMRAEGYLEDCELVNYHDRPACELSFIIILPNGFKYRGYVDAVLQHRITGKIVVLECKTTAAKYINPGTYRNSAQAIGYSIVLDAIFPELSGYEVLYLVYNTMSYSYEQYPFSKSYVQRARWIRELVLDVELIQRYEEAEIYPMHGESCLEYNKECKYIGICTMSKERITKPLTQLEYDKLVGDHEEFQIQVTLDDLIVKQLEKAES